MGPPRCAIGVASFTGDPSPSPFESEGEVAFDRPMRDVGVDTPSHHSHTLQSEALAAGFAGGFSPPPCRPGGGVTLNQSLREVAGDRGGTCRTPCDGGGVRSLNDHHIHEGPAPRKAFNREGIG